MRQARRCELLPKWQAEQLAFQLGKTVVGCELLPKWQAEQPFFLSEEGHTSL